MNKVFKLINDRVEIAGTQLKFYKKYSSNTNILLKSS